MYCRNCGSDLGEKKVCPECGAHQGTSSGYKDLSKSRVFIGVIGLVLGPLGIHNFILGHTDRGLVQLLVTVIGSLLTCGIAAFGMWVWSLIESIQILTGAINVDAQGNPLE